MSLRNSEVSRLDGYRCEPVQGSLLLKPGLTLLGSQQEQLRKSPLREKQHQHCQSTGKIMCILSRLFSLLKKNL